MDHRIWLLLLPIFFSVLYGLAFYPIVITLWLDGDGNFYAVLRWFRHDRVLYDSVYPVDPRDFTYRKLRKRMRKIEKNKRRNRSPEEVGFAGDLRFYTELLSRLLRVNGNGSVPGLRITVHDFRLTVSHPEPDAAVFRYGLLCAAVASALDYLAASCRVRFPEDSAVTVTPAVAPASIKASFRVTFSLPLLSYTKLFGFNVPDREKLLYTLKRQEKQRKSKYKTRQKAVVRDV